jgi:hypothetical protein
MAKEQRKGEILEMARKDKLWEGRKEGSKEGRKVPYLVLHFLDYVGAAVPVTMIGSGICVFNPTTCS